MSPTFPLNPPPNCPFCGSVAQRDLTKNLGSAGRRRPYYFCINNHKRKFVRWDDNEGISNNNPQCKCGHSSRLNVNGTNNWYDCSSMSCNFRSNAPANVDAVELDSTPSVHGVSAPSTYQGSTGSSTYPVVSGPDRSFITVTVSDTLNIEEIRSIDRKVEDIQQHLASLGLTSTTVPVTRTPPINPKCQLHGNGRRSFFRRTHCSC